MLNQRIARTPKVGSQNIETLSASECYNKHIKNEQFSNIPGNRFQNEAQFEQWLTSITAGGTGGSGSSRSAGQPHDSTLQYLESTEAVYALVQTSGQSGT